MGFTMSCPLSAAAGAAAPPGTLSLPTQHTPPAQTIPANPAGHTAQLPDHGQRTPALLCQLQEMGSVPCDQCHRSLEPLHVLSAVHPHLWLPNTLAPAFQTCQSVLPFTKQNHTHVENQHPPSLDNSQAAKQEPGLSSFPA